MKLPVVVRFNDVSDFLSELAANDLPIEGGRVRVACLQEVLPGGITVRLSLCATCVVDNEVLILTLLQGSCFTSDSPAIYLALGRYTRAAQALTQALVKIGLKVRSGMIVV